MLQEMIEFGRNPGQTLEGIALSFRSMIGDDKGCLGVKAMVAHIEELFLMHHVNNSFLEFQDGKDTVMVFETGHTFGNSLERIFGVTTKNKNFYSSKVYFSLRFMRESLLRSKLMEGVHVADFHFQDFYALNTFLESVATKALTEPWRFANDTSKLQYPILKNLLEFTYYQAFRQKKISRNEMEGVVVYNTGLVTNEIQEIYVMADIVPYEKPNALFKEYYTNPRVVVSGSYNFGCLVLDIPNPPVFYDKTAKELFFDLEAASRPGGILLNEAHIFGENWNRIADTMGPEALQYSSSVQLRKVAFENAVRLSLRMERVRPVVVSQVNAESGRVQFLLPVFMGGYCEQNIDGERVTVLPNCVLVLDDTGNGYYRGSTILSLNMAYQNTRLLRRPDCFWLDPTKLLASNMERKGGIAA